MFFSKKTVKPSPFEVTACLLTCCEVTVWVTDGDGSDGFPPFLPKFLSKALVFRLPFSTFVCFVCSFLSSNNTGI